MWVTLVAKGLNGERGRENINKDNKKGSRSTKENNAEPLGEDLKVSSCTELFGKVGKVHLVGTNDQLGHEFVR